MNLFATNIADAPEVVPKSIWRTSFDNWFPSSLVGAEDGIGSQSSSKQRPKIDKYHARRRPNLLMPLLGVGGQQHRIKWDNQECYIQPILSLDDYSKKEHKNAFYNGQELRAMYENARDLVSTLLEDGGEYDDEQVECRRGLERLHGERRQTCLR